MVLENEQCRVLVEQGRLSEDQAHYALQALQGQQIDLCELLVTWGHIGESTAEMVRVLVTQGAQKKVFGNYEILGELSRGGMGVVYRARQRMSGRIVALKLMLDGSDPEENLRFRREAQALAKLAHPSIIPIYDCGHHNDVPYFTMELVEGKDLHTYIQEEIQSTGKPPDWEWCCEIISQVASALEECHELGLSHRDVKPRNILIRNDSQEPILVDFGLVKVHAKTNLGESISASLTSEGQMVGTPTYMAPEQFDAIKGTVGAPADVWGLAGTLYFCLTGGRPFDGDDLVYIFCSIKEGFDDSKLSVKHYSAPEALSKLLKDCFELEASERPSMPSFRKSLEDILNQSGHRPAETAMKMVAGALLIALIGVITLIVIEVSSVKAPQRNESKDSKITLVLKTETPIQILFDPAVKKGVLDSSGPLNLTVIGKSLTEILIDGKSIPIDNKTISIPLENRRDIAVKVTDSNGQVTSRVIEVIPRSTLISALQNRGVWNEIANWKKLLIVKDLAAKLKGQGFSFDSMEEFRAGNQRHMIAVFRHKNTGLIFHLLPGGRFEMGTANAPETVRFCELNSKPFKSLSFEELVDLEVPIQPHRLAPFLMSKHEVSVAIWKSQLSAKQLLSTDWAPRKDLKNSHPMIGLYWESTFNWINQVGCGFRLPREAEWEYACRAGTNSHFFWGDDAVKVHANIQRPRNGRDTIEFLEDVDFAQKRTNAFGLVHMCGNASEWVWEVFQSYKFGVSPSRAKRKPRTLRGGSAVSALAMGRSRSRWRTHGKPTLRTALTGFRVAVSLPKGFLKN
ncbi:MAG: bifunctional serine/threonine-protein kinase/formylglycine-generating enzyme family protein [Planctomycetota bacterium]|nr:bifunctional serine/threonine-protein kinase/formylglycine-generating enzyme family protein [Planctomycetota bacterium]